MSDLAVMGRAERQITFGPTTFTEAMTFSEMVAKSDFAPSAYRGKPASVFLAIQMGAELGLAPMQALQNIAVINGKPSVYGDAALAVVQNHPAYEWHKEFFEGETAVFQIKRRGNEVHEVKFGTAEAKTANLLGKEGPWRTYPKRMMQMRARGFGLRDKFADALRGLITAEEAMDYPDAKPVKPEAFTTELLDKPDTLSITAGSGDPHEDKQKHPAATCKSCLTAGVPKDCVAVLINGHIYISRGDKSPIHDFDHKSHVYCPACKEDFKKEQASPVLPVQETVAVEAADSAASQETPEPTGLFQSGNPEVIAKVEAVMEKHDKKITAKERASLIKTAVESGWTDAEINDALKTKFKLGSIADVTVGQLNDILNHFLTGGANV